MSFFGEEDAFSFLHNNYRDRSDDDDDDMMMRVMVMLLLPMEKKTM
jgi:hypothetical protein